MLTDSRGNPKPGASTVHLACSLYRELSRESENENLMFSPYAIATALLMLLAGSRGRTREEIARALEDGGEGDTRYSGSELIVRRLTEMGAEIRVHDPYVEHWWELEAQDSYPAPGHSKGRFFHRQEKLADLRIERDVWQAMRDVDAIVLAVRHRAYLDLDPDAVVRAVGQPCAIVDCFCILDDAQIRRYFELGCEVKGMGRGHIQRIKEQARRRA